MLLGALALYLAAAGAVSTDTRPPETAEAIAAAEIATAKKWPWLRRPTGDDYQEVFPDDALSKGKEYGRARMQCVVDTAGLLTNCKILSEDPEGVGFGGATLRLSRKFRMASKFKDGKTTEGESVVIPLQMFAGALAEKRFSTGEWPTISLPTSHISRANTPTGHALVRCTVSGLSPKPTFEPCIVVEAQPPELGNIAARLAEAIPLPSGTPGGFKFKIPFVFEPPAPIPAAN